MVGELMEALQGKSGRRPLEVLLDNELLHGKVTGAIRTQVKDHILKNTVGRPLKDTIDGILLGGK